MKKLFKGLLVAGIITTLSLASLNNDYHATDTNDREEIEVYLLGSGYADAYPTARINGIPYYEFGGGLAGSNKVNSTLDNADKWRKYDYTIDKQIPKKVGKYDVLEVEYIKPFSLGQHTIDDLKDSLTWDMKPKQGIFSNNEAIVFNGVWNGEAVVYPVNEKEKEVYDYAASQYTFSQPTIKDDKVSFKVNTNWEAQQTADNLSGELWNSFDKLQKVMNDAKDIIDNILAKEYPTRAEYTKNMLNSSFIKKADYLSSNPGSGISTRHKPASDFDTTNHKCVSRVCFKEGHKQYKSQISSTTDYETWRNYWSNYTVPGGLPGHEGDSEYSWNSLWNGTYMDKASDGAPNVRVYQPYVIKLKVSAGVDLEMTDNSDAYYKNGYLYVKAVARNLKSAKAEEIDNVDFSITNKTVMNFNTYEGKSDDFKLPVGKEIDLIGNNINIKNISGITEVSKEGSYLKFPIKPHDQEQTLVIRLEINKDKKPEEVDYDNNLWRKEITIPSQKPDLIASNIYHSATNTQVGQSPKVNINYVTTDKDFDKNKSYLEEREDSPVMTQVWVDGNLHSKTFHTHPLTSGVYTEVKPITLPPFTNSKKQYTIKVQLHINPTEDMPDFEKTYNNNMIEKTFIIKAEEKPKLPESDPELPKFTNMETCIYLDKDKPQTDSKLLISMGTFKVKHQTPKPGTWPDGSEISWKAGESAPPRMNPGVPSVEWKAAFPEKGKNGWVTLASEGETGGCNWCLYDPATYDFYLEFLREYQATATFASWDTQQFQQSKGTVFKVVDKGTIKYLRIVSKQASNTKPCEGMCCTQDRTQNNEYYSPSELHKHHTHSHSYEVTVYCDDDEDCDGHTESRNCYQRIHEVQGDSCPSSCHGNSLCGVTYSNKNPIHYHPHTEYRLEYAAEVTLTYNVKLNKIDSKVMDYGTGDKITRAGYGISTPVNDVTYVTDYSTELIENDGDYGQFSIKPIKGQAYVKTPATNKTKPYLITRLEANGVSAPFIRKWRNIENQASPMKYREIFTDVDYPDTNQFPVYYTIMYLPDDFSPAPSQYLTSAEQQLLTKHPRLKPALGICDKDTIVIKGNMWNDSWTRPTRK